MKTFNEQLILAGARAKGARKDFGAASKQYSVYIEDIDKLAAAWKATQPQLFWDEDSPEYKEMSRRWQKRRDARSVPVAMKGVL